MVEDTSRIVPHLRSLASDSSARALPGDAPGLRVVPREAEPIHPDDLPVCPQQDQHLGLVEQFSRYMAEGQGPQRTLRLALRTVVAGIPSAVGAHVGLLDTARVTLRVVDCIGRQSHSLRGREFPLADLLAAPRLAGENGTSTARLIRLGDRERALSFVVGGADLLAFPLLVQGEPSGLLAVHVPRSFQCTGDQQHFLDVMANLVVLAVGRAQLQDDLAERGREATVLAQLEAGAIQGMPFPQVATILARTARELTRSAGASLSAVSAEGKSRIRLVAWGRGRHLRLPCEEPMKAGLAAWAILHGEPAFSNDLLSDPRADLAQARWTGTLRAAAVPLLLRGRVIGSLAVYNARQVYDQGDIDLLRHLAIHASTAIEQASLSDRYRSTPLARTLIWKMLREEEPRAGHLAVAEERSRIARELHDGVAQKLGELNFRVQSLERELAAVRGPRLKEARRELEALSIGIHGTYDEVRGHIAALDTRPRIGDDFTSALRALVGSATGRGRPTVSLERCDEGIKLPPLIGLRLLQIAGEALANAQKHAAASRISVALEARGDLIELSVSDDGRGCVWPITRSRRNHFGLTMMRERAEEIGARFSLTNREGGGTRVAVTLPVYTRGGA